MSSGAAASVRAFGLDRGLPFPLEDISHAGAVLLAGGNPGETMPPLMQYFAHQRANGGQLLVVDPRTSTTAQWATIHLRLRPGTDAALANGLLHVLIRDALIDESCIAARTEGFDAVRHVAQAYDPQRVEAITGVPAPDLVRAAAILGTASSTMVLTGRGPEQQSHGVDNALAYINLALALGQVGRPGGGEDGIGTSHLPLDPLTLDPVLHFTASVHTFPRTSPRSNTITSPRGDHSG